MSTLAKIRIGTRKSPLALVQAEEVGTRLKTAWPGCEIELISMITSGDTFTDKPLADIGGKGLFTKEIEAALLDGRIDIAVHSMKDMSTILPDGLIIGCMLEREDPRDMLVGRDISSLAAIPRGASFGTSSLRRSAQLLMLRPDINIVPLRGNVQTRLSKIENGTIRATMLAIAGIKRLGLKEVPGAVLPQSEFLPAIAQGAIGVECRANDTNIIERLKPLSHPPTEMAVGCERAFLRELDGSCRTPIAGYAEIINDRLEFNGLIVKPDGSQHYSIKGSGDPADAIAIGQRCGQNLLEKAGKKFY